MFRLKLKAGALQLTTFIIVVIALLLTAFILLVHVHKQFQVQSDFIIETTKQSNNGMDYVLQNSIPLSDTTSIKLDSEDYKTLKVYRGFWGVFEKVVSTATIKNKRFQKIALIGSKQPKSNRRALYIQDNNKPLVLVGNTKIEGLAYLPRQGVKPGYISGQSYYGSRLIYGPTRVASKLPKLSSGITKSISQLESISSILSQDQFLNIQEENAYSNSFLKPLQIVYSNTEIDLEQVELTGHIVVQSKSKITVHSSTKLRDVVLVAPEIVIQPNTVGSFQAIASKEIMVGKDVSLNYPSALVLKELPKNEQNDNATNTIKQTPRITIDENAKVKGLVMYLGEEKPNNYKPQVLLKENALVYGELYNTQNTELLGLVYGSVFTNNFIANQSGSVYQNHIYNGTITINDLPKEYIGLLFEDSKKGIMKLLY
ncbi:MAG: hypothetical protein Tsb0033_15920 [Winogradskyella sp.]